MDLANRKSLVGPIRSDSGGLRKVRKQLEQVERLDEEEETAVFFTKFFFKESKY